MARCARRRRPNSNGQRAGATRFRANAVHAALAAGRTAEAADEGRALVASLGDSRQSRVLAFVRLNLFAALLAEGALSRGAGSCDRRVAAGATIRTARLVGRPPGVTRGAGTAAADGGSAGRLCRCGLWPDPQRAQVQRGPIDGAGTGPRTGSRLATRPSRAAGTRARAWTTLRSMHWRWARLAPAIDGALPAR